MTNNKQAMSETPAAAAAPSVSRIVMKLLAAAAISWGAISRYSATSPASNAVIQSDHALPESMHRRLSEAVVVGDEVPSYMQKTMDDYEAREKLFRETPEKEVKYWFEYTGALQKYFYRYSKTRAKAEYFEGRDDSGVVSQRFVDQLLGNAEFRDFYTRKDIPSSEQSQYTRLLENCLALGSKNRPDTSDGSQWHTWFGGSSGASAAADRCRLLMVINTVGAGRGSTMLWETTPPPVNTEGPQPWVSEQETAADKIQRQLAEVDALCASGLVAARVQMLVCEPIPDVWTEWMDSLLPHCGGKTWPYNHPLPTRMEDRASPVQVVVAGSVKTADVCHDLKSGFMEQRMQDLILTSLDDNGSKATHPDLVSSDHHDLFLATKWSSLVTVRAINSFLQASADLAAAAASPEASKQVNGPSSPFLIPSFVRVSYVSEENSKIAKWRMHGDFFHPAAWEICRDSFETTWIPHSLSGAGGVSGLCYDSATSSQLQTSRHLKESVDCGQYWLYFTELQMPTNPEVYANEQVPAPVAGGSNFVYMLTEMQRAELVKGLECRLSNKKDCPSEPQGVIPLGDLESFLINYTPNTALGKKHVEGRRPGYTHEEERQRELQLVRERKQLKDQDDIEKALFDYTIYPAALFHKDATLKAARARDAELTSTDQEGLGPQTVKSSYYDVTIVKPRGPLLGWCQAIARHGLCTLYSDYFRTSSDIRCQEACGLKRDFTKM